MWHAMNVESILKKLNTDLEKGLSNEEAKKRLKIYGPNEIKREKRRSAIKIFLSQFTSPLVILLIFAAAMSLFLGEKNDSILISIIIIINGILGFYQEYKAERAIEELAKMAVPKVIVIRDGKKKVISSTELVPGDVVILNEGDVVPADIRVVETRGIQVDESILTGESIPVEKENVVLPENIPIYKRKNMLFMGTVIVRGSCKGIVVKTGKRTELGKIAHKLEKIEEKKSAMRVEIENLASFLTKITIIIIGVTFILSLMFSTFRTAILLAISLGVAAIPEGLPIVITIAMALGAQRMLKKRVLIRKLEAIKNLGAVDVICTDKTGTLTEGKMIPKVFFDGKGIKIIDNLKPGISKNFDLFLKISLLCNDLKEIEGKITGDFLEVSLFNFCKKYCQEILGIGPNLDEIKKKIVKVNPFDSTRKMMSVFIDEGVLLVKGAPEKIVTKSKWILIDGKEHELKEDDKRKLMKVYEELASDGYYTIGLAYGKSEKEEDLVFVGFVGLADNIRERVKEAIKLAKEAKIRVVMVTGDNKHTAIKIAKEIGMEIEGVMEGEEIRNLSDDKLREIVEKVNIFARVSPDDKYRILVALQKNGHIVGMTGDGVNDALALKKADVGIAMGIRGAEVVKQVADVVILDDNFATIIDGIKEGRGIVNNIYKFVNYLLTCNVGEVLSVFIASLFKKVLLTPIQILWVNLITDGPVATALAVDPAPEDIMKRKPRRKFVDRTLKWLIGVIGIKKTIFMLLSFFIPLFLWGPKVAATTVFTFVILSEFIRLGVIRTLERMSFFANKYLIIALFSSIVLQVILIYTGLGKYFGIVPLSINHWAFLGVLTGIGYILGIFLTELIMKITEEKRK